MQPTIDATDRALLSPVAPKSFMHSTWSDRAVVVGILAILVPRIASLLPLPMSLAPLWLVLGMGLQLFVLVFPLLTRRQDPAGEFVMPGWRQWLLEGVLAAPLVLAGLFSLSLVQLVLVRLWPEASFTPEVSRRLSQSALGAQTYLFFVMAVLWAPLAEEIFFRGFLLNAFRARMPLPAAITLSAAIFAGAHSYALVPSLAIFAAGIGLACVYLWRQSLVAPIMVHGVLNSFGVLGILAMMQLHAAGPAIGISSAPQPADPSFQAQGCVVDGIVPDGPAHRAGIQVGDVIVRVAPHEVQPLDKDALQPRQPKPTEALAVVDIESLSIVLGRYSVGDVVRITIRRKDEAIVFPVTLVAQKDLPQAKLIVADEASDDPSPDDQQNSTTPNSME